MLKFTDTQVTFAEVPDEICLCINLTNCPCHCKGCHSPYLAEDIGEVLVYSKIERLIRENKGITTICFMGGDSDPKLINHYASLIKKEYVRELECTCTINRHINLPKGISLSPGDNIEIYKNIPTPIKVAWYSGRDEISKDIDPWWFDYIKVGSYQEDKGPLNKRGTNQRMYKVAHLTSGKSKLMDITYKFWKDETED